MAAAVRHSVLQGVTVCCSVFQCVAACCGVLLLNALYTMAAALTFEDFYLLEGLIVVGLEF